MTLRVIGSSSSGNCYILDGQTEALIIECGCPMHEIKETLNWQIGKIAGAIVSHCHSDHSGYIREVLRSGICVLALQDVFDVKGVSQNPFAVAIVPNKGYKVGGFLIQPFPVHHDVPCVGYIIQHAEMGKLLFVTDTAAMGYKINGLNHIMIEANYADDIVDYNIEHGSISAAMRSRLFGSHLELETAKRVLRRQNLSDVINIILIHLSNGNSNEKRFIGEIAALTGKPTYAAKKGLAINLSKNPY